MRNEFCDAMVERSGDSRFVFLTGDLGFGALEPLQKVAGERFINAGIAEQNMVSMAAGLAERGLEPWVYSIAPFLYARPLEQIRNDVCHHGFPVKLVGNGGGYAYGVMGATHHAIEDYGILLTLPGLRVFIPAFEEDVRPIVQKLSVLPTPAYLRLGRDEKPKGIELRNYEPWRKILHGQKATLLAVGPLAGGLLAAYQGLEEGKRPSLWVLTELPVMDGTVPPGFLEDLERTGHLAVAEEHVAHGGVGEMMARVLLLAGKTPRRFTHHFARGYLSGYYGSQSFHRKESGLAPEDILKEINR